MPRPKINRKMVTPPKFKGFKPYGYYAEEQAPVLMLYEEYETIRLCDYELLSQSEVAKFMGVSRPTVTRIYESARRKVAVAFSEARSIVIEGGNVFFDANWFHCNFCKCHFNNPENNKKLKCPLCNSKSISSVNTNREISEKYSTKIKNAIILFYVGCSKSSFIHNTFAKNKDF